MLRLRKALYGLRQAPRAWNAKLDATLGELGFQRCATEHALYMRQRGKDELSAIVMHKACLIAQGFVQREGIDFEEVFALVARMESVRLLLFLAAAKD